MSFPRKSWCQNCWRKKSCVLIRVAKYRL